MKSYHSNENTIRETWETCSKNFTNKSNLRKNIHTFHSETEKSIIDKATKEVNQEDNEEFHCCTSRLYSLQVCITSATGSEIVRCATAG